MFATSHARLNDVLGQMSMYEKFWVTTTNKWEISQLPPILQLIKVLEMSQFNKTWINLLIMNVKLAEILDNGPKWTMDMLLRELVIRASQQVRNLLILELYPTVRDVISVLIPNGFEIRIFSNI
jgi:hypothetical protein